MERPIPGNLYWGPKALRRVSLKTTSSTIAIMIMIMMVMMMKMRIAKMSNQGNKLGRKNIYKNKMAVGDGQAGGKT